MPRTLFCVMTLVIIFTLNPTARSGRPDTAEIIRAEVEQIRYAKKYRVGRVYVTGADLTAEFFDGQMTFKDDIYQRDPALLKALDSPFRFHDES